jgi:hypothetical protein
LNITQKKREQNPKTPNRFRKWIKRVGVLGFLFFLIKGLLWLLIPYLIAKGVFK